MKGFQIAQPIGLAGKRPEPSGSRGSVRSASVLRQVLCLAASLALAASRDAATATTATEAAGTVRFTPLSGPAVYFESSPVREDGAASFVARTRDCDLLIAPTQVTLALGNSGSSFAGTPMERIALSEAGSGVSRLVRLQLAGANPRARLAGCEQLAGRVNYFLGNDPSEWRTGLPLFGRVRVDELYPGIDLIYYCSAQQLEYDFRLQPGADPSRIAIRCEGADRVLVDSEGNLVLQIGGQEVRHHRPIVYQFVNGARKQIEGSYRLRGNDTVGFHLGEYNRHLPLVIDPVLSFSTYLGGKKNDRGWAVAADGMGSVYVCGETLSLNLPTTPGALMEVYQKGMQQYGDAFVAKYTGTNLDFLTYFGGKGQDGAFAIAVDKTSNSAVLTGFTDSLNFPITPTNVFQSQFGGTNLNGRHVFPLDAFVTKLDSSGGLVYSTLLGGNHREVGMGIAVDTLGRPYIAGYTESSNYPTVNALEGSYVRGRVAGTVTNYSGAIYHKNGDAFVARLSADATSLEYFSFLGGTNQDVAQGIAVDDSFHAFVVGLTSSTNFPTTQPLAWQLNATSKKNVATDGFLSVLSDTGDQLLYSAFLGGNENDAATAVAVDKASNAYVTGYTYSTNSNPETYFPPLTSTNFLMYVSRTNVNADVFVMKFAPIDGVPENGYSATNGYSVVFGGRKLDQGLGIALDSSGDAYVVGLSSSTNIAGTDSAFMTNYFATNRFGGFTATNSSIRSHGINDAFLVELDPTGANLLFSAFLGGSWNDQANGISFDAAAQVAYIVGTTFSPDLPLENPTQRIPGSSKHHSDAFVGSVDFSDAGNATPASANRRPPLPDPIWSWRHN